MHEWTGDSLDGDTCTTGRDESYNIKSNTGHKERREKKKAECRAHMNCCRLKYRCPRRCLSGCCYPPRLLHSGSNSVCSSLPYLQHRCTRRDTAEQRAEQRGRTRTGGAGWAGTGTTVQTLMGSRGWEVTSLLRGNVDLCLHNLHHGWQVPAYVSVTHISITCYAVARTISHQYLFQSVRS